MVEIVMRSTCKNNNDSDYNNDSNYDYNNDGNYNYNDDGNYNNKIHISGRGNNFICSNDEI